MRKVFEVKASPWIGNRIASTYKVCAKSSADAKAVIKKQPEINSFLYNDNGFRVKELSERTEGWKTNEVRRCD